MNLGSSFGDPSPVVLCTIVCWCSSVRPITRTLYLGCDPYSELRIQVVLCYLGIIASSVGDAAIPKAGPVVPMSEFSVADAPPAMPTVGWIHQSAAPVLVRHSVTAELDAFIEGSNSNNPGELILSYTQSLPSERNMSQLFQAELVYPQLHGENSPVTD